jgi:hypothetical protein
MLIQPKIGNRKNGRYSARSTASIRGCGCSLKWEIRKMEGTQQGALQVLEGVDTFQNRE